ncbi:type I restriction enzyme, S subunit [Flavobacterium omnivorum]|uniref:Type I restriction enzyme, S subunit n=1 Tax=Flavobacterium omnivorum TaxID=178355 RepID=A0A1G8BI52_9FLAO|nr:restriction endonuclease subunit S [Flavobacterium omnivorum]SDH32858.1 type I restriction enzyme, S subunit [Flavobacterium omnivorum]
MSWKKVRLGDLCTIEKGKTGIQKAVPGDYPLVVTAEDRKSHNDYQFDDEAVIIPLVSGTGHGHASIKRLHFQSGKFALGSILCAVIPKDKSILNAEYLFRFLNLNKERELVDRMKGMANVTLPIKEIAKIEIPLPSLDEQIEFVEKYALLETDSEEISSELNHQLDLIKQLRQAFLREAMQGKLVKSTKTKETGQQLLTKIKAAKAQLISDKKLKKEKELAPISVDEIPFKIPEHWAWCRLGEIIYDTDSGKSPNCINQPANEKQWGVIKTTAVQEMFFLENENKILPENFIVNEQHKIYEGDILITRAGPKNRVGVVCCVENLTKNLILSDKTIRIKFLKKLLSPKYFTIALNSPLIKKNIEKKMTGMADSQVNITQDNIKGFQVPLPPLHEQEQIVAKLEELMAFCDGLEQSIKESQGCNEMLLQQVLREALHGEEKVF